MKLLNRLSLIVATLATLAVLTPAVGASHSTTNGLTLNCGSVKNYQIGSGGTFIANCPW